MTSSLHGGHRNTPSHYRAERGSPELDASSATMTSSSPMATRCYTVLIEKGPRSYGATVPDLPGCVAVATSRREVLRLITEAIPLHISAIEADGETVPELVHEAVVVDVGSTAAP